MTRFEAIEARASQYPASTNDVVWLIARIRELRSALQAVTADDLGSCDDIGSAAWLACFDALAALDEPNLPVS